MKIPTRKKKSNPLKGGKGQPNVPANAEVQPDVTVPMPKPKSRPGHSGHSKPKPHAPKPKTPNTGLTPSGLPVDPSMPLTPQGIAALSNAAARLRYGSQIRESKQGIADSTQRQTNISGFYQTYLNRLGAARAASAAAYADAGQPIVNGAQAASGTPEAQAALSNQQNLSGAFAKMIQGQGVNNTTRYDDMQSNASLAEVGHHLEEDRNKVKLQQALAGLLGDRDAFRTDYRGQLIDKERQYGLDLRHQGAEETAVGVNADVDMAKIQAGKQTAKQKLNQTVNQWGYTHKEWVKMAPAKRQQIITQQKKAAQAPPKPGDHYGYTDKEWAAMNHAQKLQAAKQFHKATTNGKGKNGVSFEQGRTHSNQFQQALQAARDFGPTDPGLLPYLIAPQGSKGAGVPSDLAKIVDYWAKHKAHITPEMYAYLTKKLGVDKGLLKGHVVG